MTKTLAIALTPGSAIVFGPDCQFDVMPSDSVSEGDQCFKLTPTQSQINVPLNKAQRLAVLRKPEIANRMIGVSDGPKATIAENYRDGLQYFSIVDGEIGTDRRTAFFWLRALFWTLECDVLLITDRHWLTYMDAETAWSIDVSTQLAQSLLAEKSAAQRSQCIALPEVRSEVALALKDVYDLHRGDFKGRVLIRLMNAYRLVREFDPGPLLLAKLGVLALALVIVNGIYSYNMHSIHEQHNLAHSARYTAVTGEPVIRLDLQLTDQVQRLLNQSDSFYPVVIPIAFSGIEEEGLESMSYENARLTLLFADTFYAEKAYQSLSVLTGQVSQTGKTVVISNEAP